MGCLFSNDDDSGDATTTTVVKKTPYAFAPVKPAVEVHYVERKHRDPLRRRALTMATVLEGAAGVDVERCFDEGGVLAACVLDEAGEARVSPDSSHFVAFLFLERHKRLLTVHSVAIDESFRDVGALGALLDATREFARTTGGDVVAVTIPPPTSSVCRKAFARKGFVCVDSVRGTLQATLKQMDVAAAAAR
jgi:hypothetical protein